MPTKKRGALLAGMSAALGICLTGQGCQSHSLNGSPPVAAGNSSGGLNPTWAKLFKGRSSEEKVSTSAPSMVVQGTPIASSTAPMQSEPDGPKSTVIASSYRSADRITAEPPLDLAPSVTLVASSSPVSDDGQRLRPVAVAASGPVLDAKMSIPQDVATPARLVPEPQLVSSTANLTAEGLKGKVYFIITDGDGQGEQVYRVPLAANETVLDAIAQIKGLMFVASKKNIWVARNTAGASAAPKLMPVDWKGITQRGSTATNYPIVAGDRIYVKADGGTAGIVATTRPAPLQRLFTRKFWSKSTEGSN